MQEFERIASVVGHESLDESFAVAFPRRELESLREAGEPAQLWVELEKEGNGGPKRITIDLTQSDIEQLLQHPNGDDVLIALDGYALHGLFDEADVEGHGLRSALAIAVVVGGLAAPAGLAANPQVSTAQAVNPQLAKAAQTAQVANPATAQAQVSTAAARAQVSTAAAKAQVSKAAARAQVSKSAARAQISLAGIRWKAAGVLPQGKRFH
jgi:hypothetical protein